MKKTSSFWVEIFREIKENPYETKELRVILGTEKIFLVSKKEEKEVSLSSFLFKKLNVIWENHWNEERSICFFDKNGKAGVVHFVDGVYLHATPINEKIVIHATLQKDVVEKWRKDYYLHHHLPKKERVSRRKLREIICK